ncbi:hypothetical protein WMY93_029946 [Mugilogobius chulae]|uniref:Uncharacterized protein n=1 Tax=Mugilogobius chulae TaxID=88201 RepID=A0AAW0ML99_9GOBI
MPSDASPRSPSFLHRQDGGRRVWYNFGAASSVQTRPYHARCDHTHTSVSRIISRQATINIGTIGHVAHGKSTVVKAISGVHTVRFKNELERNITIKLGYANAKIYKLDDLSCPRPECYRHVAPALQTSFPQTCPGPKATSNWSDTCRLWIVRVTTF